MKNKLTITISDVSSTKSYSVHQIVKKVIFSVIIIAIVVIGGAFYFINYLSDEITDINKTKAKEIKTLINKEKKLQAQNLFYEMQIKGKVKDIEELSSKLDSIEEIVGLKKDDETRDVITRATITQISLAQKMYMLTTIPSGSPLKEFKKTANFGYRIHPITRQKRFHRGIDLKAKRKTPVYATADGVVKFVQSRNIGDFGRVVMISHNFGFETTYAHLNKTNVKLGDIVKKNQLLGLSGNSGRSTGPHLHYEVKYASKVLDPIDFIKWSLKTYEKIFEKQRRVQWESLIKLIKSQHKLEQL